MSVEAQRVYVHGLGQTAAGWEKVAGCLRASGLPGNSTYLCLTELIAGQEASWQNLYTAFSDVCSDVYGRYAVPLDFCGLSLGGVLALNYAIDHPERTRSLVLIAAQYRMPRTLLRVQDVLFRLMPASLFGTSGMGKEDMRRLCRTMQDLDFPVSRITCPVVVVCGDRDRANRRASRELAACLPGAEHQTVPHAGHEVNKDAPEVLANLLRRFWFQF